MAFGPDHPQLARTLVNLGIVQRDLGALKKAEATLTRALAIEEKAHGPDHPKVAITFGNLGAVQRDQHRFEEALDCYERAATIFAAKLGEQHPNTTRARRLITDLWRELKH
jgi:Tfp pilus assembly protein PilF